MTDSPPWHERPNVTPLEFAPTAALLAAAIDALDDLGAGGGGAVDAGRRRDAFAHYAAAGAETALPANWRHPYAALAFDDLVWSSGRRPVPALPPLAVPRAAQSGDGDAPALAVENAGGIVHLGAIYLHPRASRVAANVTLAALADARRTAPATLETVAHRIVAPDADRFTALATAFQNCGAYVEIGAGAEVTSPLQLVWSAGPQAAAVFPHTIVRVGANARVTIVERHIGAAESFVCGIVEVELAPGAQLDYVVVQRADEGARIIMHRGATVGAGARIGWHVADLGGALVRSTASTLLTGARAGATLDAFAFADGFVNAEIRASVRHAAPRTQSRATVRRAAGERGSSRFVASVAVDPGAERADAVLRDGALILGPAAGLDSRPALTAQADRVSALVATAVGSIDEEAIFYVQSRGIPRRVAERMMAVAFFEPAIAGFPSDALRDEVRTALDERLDRVGETFAT